ncbi:uncharacterized protein LOC142559790 isoform X2 [Dermacentor variabilis]|uniref:uncharacterized protein LOC142559790 isoform X2 n=1 Tax=Dermacentor variabilis TaxID=34621 RepID=UPI003F5B43B5
MILICQVPRELIFFVTHRLDRHTGQPVLQCTSTGECATWPFLQRTRRSRGEGAASSQLGECARRTSSQLLEEPWGERSALGECLGLLFSVDGCSWKQLTIGLSTQLTAHLAVGCMERILSLSLRKKREYLT